MFAKSISNPQIIPTAAGRREVVQRYRRAAHILEQCQHNHIVRMIDFQDTDTEQEIQINLELAQYGSVQRFGSSGPEKRSEFRHRVEQVIQIVDALAYLHSTIGVVHGSIDLSHMLMFEREEQNPTWPSGLTKLGGFGHALRIGEMGTPQTALDCRPPESFPLSKQGPIAYNEFRSIKMAGSYDVYSVGRVLLRWVLKVDVERELREKVGGSSKEEYAAVFDKHVKKIQDGSCIQEGLQGVPAW